MLNKLNLRWICTAALFVIVCLPIFAPSANCETYREAYKRGNSLRDSGDEEGAINAYTLAKSMAPSQMNDASLELARLYAKLSRYSEADAEYKNILTHSNNISLKYEYGQFLVNQGKFSVAQGYWNEILGANSEDQMALYYVGLCCESSESIDMARDYYQKAISISPTSSVGQHAASKLKRIEQVNENRASGGKYFLVDPETSSHGYGNWRMDKMPIHVYIDDGSDCQGFRPEMRNFVLAATEAWRQASGNQITFVIDLPDPQAEAKWKAAFKGDPLIKYVTKDYPPADPVKTGIHVHWTTSLAERALGLAWPSTISFTKEGGDRTRTDSTKHQEIVFCHIWLITNRFADNSKIPSSINASNSNLIEKQDRMLAEVTIHEFGHALGLPHSSNSRDIMCSGIFALNSTDLLDARSLSPGDLAALRMHYNEYDGSAISASVPDTGSKASSPSTVTTVAKGSSAVELGSTLFTQKSQANKTAGQGSIGNSELANALFDVNSKRYPEGLQKLNTLLLKQPSNMQAVYLRAVVHVMMHNYDSAVKDYETVIKNDAGSALAKRASDGLSKIKGH